MIPSRPRASTGQILVAALCLTVAARGLAVPLHLALESHTFAPHRAALDSAGTAQATSASHHPHAHHDHSSEIHFHPHESEGSRHGDDAHAPHPADEHLSAGADDSLFGAPPADADAALLGPPPPAIPRPALLDRSLRLGTHSIWRPPPSLDASPRAPPTPA